MCYFAIFWVRWPCRAGYHIIIISTYDKISCFHISLNSTLHCQILAGGIMTSMQMGHSNSFLAESTITGTSPEKSHMRRLSQLFKEALMGDVRSGARLQSNQTPYAPHGIDSKLRGGRCSAERFDFECQIWLGKSLVRSSDEHKYFAATLLML